MECGKIVAVHGVRGELKVEPWCDTPDYLCEFSTLYLKKGAQALRVEAARVHKTMVLLKLAGVDTLDDAAELRGKILYLDRHDAPAGEDDGYFIQDLIGLAVMDIDNGRDWGKLSDVFFTGANDVYEITDVDGTKRLIPAIPDVVRGVDLAAGTMHIRPLAGLFEDADESPDGPQ